MPGKLILVATPIGNLADAGARAREALAAADVVACEDTRRTAKLLAHLGLSKSLLIYAEHNEPAAATKILARLRRGETVALVTDGGSPLLADPGYVVVRKALAAGAALDVIPGPSAAPAALALSGLPPYPYAFLGYLPRRKAERRQFLARYARMPMTAVLFITPHRLAAELADVVDVWGDRDAALCREMTKVHQEVLRGPLAGILAEVRARPRRGEMTLVTAPPAPAGDEDAALALARALVAEGLPASRAAAAAARVLGARRRDIYARLTPAPARKY
jgi:16S rRNA (cytidine1402-2'-O)-methyltransferase